MSELACRRHQRPSRASYRGPGGLVTRVPRGGIMSPHASSVLALSPENGICAASGRSSSGAGGTPGGHPARAGPGRWR